MNTLADLIERYDVEVLDYLDRQATIPVLSGPQIQGDISILPVTATAARTPLPAAGCVVATGREGHAHRLVGQGMFDLAKQVRGSLAIGTLTVPPAGVAYLAHDEHGYMGVAPGTYTIGSQREFAGIWRAVAD